MDSFVFSGYFKGFLWFFGNRGLHLISGGESIIIYVRGSRKGGYKLGGGLDQGGGT